MEKPKVSLRPYLLPANQQLKEPKFIMPLKQFEKSSRLKLTSDIKPAIDAFYDFLKVHSLDVSKGAIEKRIWTPKYRYAGTIDILGEVDGLFGILDIKTSSGIWRDYNLQTSAYMGALSKDSTAWEDLTQKEIQGRWILRIDQNQICEKCGAKKRTKGGRETIKENFNNKTNGTCDHVWSKQSESGK